MSAILSACGLYRWRLEREVAMWGIVVALFGVNPSTADADRDDQTIRKDIGFAVRNGWRTIIKGNAFAYRATDVRELARVRDPVGRENAVHLDRIIADADVLVPCWGDRAKVPKELRGHFDALLAKLRASGKPIRTFGLTKGGDPKHPLMLGYDTALTDWNTP